MVSDFLRKQKRDPRRQLFIIMGGVFILFIVIVLVIANVKIYQKKQKYITQIEDLKKKIQELQDKKVSLNEGIQNANNQIYIEKVAREELDLQKPGENVVSFIKSTDNQPKQGNNNNIFQLWIAGIGNFWNSVVSWFK